MEILRSIIFNDPPFMYDVTVHSVLKTGLDFRVRNNFLYMKSVQA